MLVNSVQKSQRRTKKVIKLMKNRFWMLGLLTVAAIGTASLPARSDVEGKNNEAVKALSFSNQDSEVVPAQETEGQLQQEQLLAQRRQSASERREVRHKAKEWKRAQQKLAKALQIIVQVNNQVQIGGTETLNSISKLLTKLLKL